MGWQDVSGLGLGETYECVLPVGGEMIPFSLERFDVMAPGTTVCVAGAGKDQLIDDPDLVLLRGQAMRREEARCFIAVAPRFVYGHVQVNEVLHVISSGPPAPSSGRHPVYIAPGIISPGSDWVCGTETPVPEHRNDGYGQPAAAGGPGNTPPARQVEMAIDTDYEFTAALFGGDTEVSSAYAIALLAGVSEVLDEHINTNLSLVFLRVWGADEDPYESTECFSAIEEFRTHWIEEESGIDRDLVHLLSGKNLEGCGGVAYFATLCSQAWGYALSSSLNGYFPYPLEDHSWDNWDMLVTAHEIGHNLSAPHTHNTDWFDPPLDGCGLGDCSNAWGGTIMSYCHTCEGGMSNIVLDYHSAISGVMLDYLDSIECDLTSCGGDLDGSGGVDFGDLLYVLSDWGPCGSECPADLNLDESVGMPDLLILLSQWGPCS